jgi:aryl carrier-like protein
MTRDGDEIRLALLKHLPPGRVLSPVTNFFEAGFSSARLVEVLAELRAGGLEVSLVDLYRFPTLQSLTAEVHERTAGGPRRPHAMPWDT